jgi:hypothetical protein
VLSDERPRIRGIADERRYYPPELIAMRRQQADVVGDALRGAPVRLMFEGGMCVFGYYSGLPYLAEMSGLTQYSLAKAPLLGERGWIGHEKQASPEWLAEHDIHLVLSHRLPPVSRPDPIPFDQVYFGDSAVARVVLYDDEVMDRLRDQPDVHFTPIERLIELRRRQIEGASRERAERIYERLDRYYLRGAGDRAKPVAAELRALIDAKS